jgi:hypothetical protein
VANELARLQAWYRAQCDGDWEHQHGVHIGTLDNPGWDVRIDLAGTYLEAAMFQSDERLESLNPWDISGHRDS